MTHRVLGLALITGLSAAPLAAADAAGDKQEWTPPRTAWGAPDLRGVWDFRTITPLERPATARGAGGLQRR